MASSPMTPSHVVIAYDATKDRGGHELKLTIDAVRLRGDILRAGDTIVVFGVLHRVMHPMGFQAKPSSKFFGTSIRVVEEEVTKKVDMYVNMLLASAEKCEEHGVIIKVKVTAGFPIKQVILQEIMACNAAWAVLDRHIRRHLRFYLKQIPCKVALIQDSLAVEVLRHHTTEDTDTIEHKMFFSVSKHVPILYCQANIGNSEHSIITCSRYSVPIGSLDRSEMLRIDMTPPSIHNLRDYTSLSPPTDSDKSGSPHTGRRK